MKKRSNQSKENKGSEREKDKRTLKGFIGSSREAPHGG